MLTWELPLQESLMRFAAMMLLNFPPWTAVIGLIGLWELYRRQKYVFFLVFPLFLAYAFLVVTFRLGAPVPSYLPAWVFLSVAVGFGWWKLLSSGGWQGFAVAILLCASPLVIYRFAPDAVRQAQMEFRAEALLDVPKELPLDHLAFQLNPDRRDLPEARAFASAALATLPEGAVVVSPSRASELMVALMRYLVEVEAQASVSFVSLGIGDELADDVYMMGLHPPHPVITTKLASHQLVAQGALLSYQALTAFCRRHGIGQPPKLPAGRYHFEPGAEMQHDTSPHRARIGGKQLLVQTASLVLCYSRVLFCQMYPRFDRFACKVFLTDALQYISGACKNCMIDNTHVVVLRGTGREMVPVAEMEAFAERYGFRFQAHEKGDSNRSARVERPFHFIEHNFLAGREFADWDELNAQARAWCDKKNALFRKHLHAAPRELFATEKPTLEPLPEWVPEVYRLHQRIVDVEGSVCVHGHRYSVPYELIGRQVEVRETKDRVLVYRGPRELASHKKLLDSKPRRISDPAHRPPRGIRLKRGPIEEERKLLAALPELDTYVSELKRRAPGRGTLALRRLWNIVRDYPHTAVIAAVRVAQHYGMFELERLERMVLRNLGDNNFFNFNDEQPDDS